MFDAIGQKSDVTERSKNGIIISLTSYFHHLTFDFTVFL